MKPAMACLVVAMALLLGPMAAALGIGDPIEPYRLNTLLEWDKTLLIPEKGTVYAIDFWATWCVPCRDSMPHLQELHERYEDKGITVVGITDENRAKVEDFFEKEDFDASYPVALDETGALWNRLAAAFGVRGIPHAFIIDGQGRVLWEGHPMDGLDAILAKVAVGEFDVAAARDAVQERQRKEVEMEIFKLRIQEYLMRNEPGLFPEKAAALKEWVMDNAAKNLETCGNVAWHILNRDHAPPEDIQFAHDLAKWAYELTNGEKLYIADTYAFALFKKGDIQQALELQQEIVEAGESDALYEEYQTHLQLYREAAGVDHDADQGA